MRHLLYAAALLVLQASTLDAQEAKLNSLTPEETAQGWVLLFDGKVATELIIEGDAKVVDGMLVVGGGQQSRVRLKPQLGGNFKLHLEYRTEGGPQPSVRMEWSHFMGGSSTSSGLQGSPGSKQWMEMTYTGHYDPQTGSRSEITQYRSLGGGMSSSSAGSGRGDDASTLTFEVPAGGKLYLRNMKLKTDRKSPGATDWSWAYSVGVLFILLIIVVGVIVWIKEKRKLAQGNG